MHKNKIMEKDAINIGLKWTSDYLEALSHNRSFRKSMMSGKAFNLPSPKKLCPKDFPHVQGTH